MKKHKIGIVTHYSANNFGAVLQCKALVDAVSLLFPSVECLVLDYAFNQRRHSPTLISVYRQKREVGIKGIFKGLVHACIFAFNYCKSAGKTSTQDFIDSIIRLDKNVHIDCSGRLCWDNESIPYSTLICGSDQIWASWCMAPHFLLMTMPNLHVGKIAYAPSFGDIDKLSPSQVDMLRKELMNYDAVSCRETDGAELISKIIQSDCPVMPDPTLLHSREYWLKLAKKPPKFPYNAKEFVFSYRISFMPHAAKIAKYTAKKLGLPLVSCELVEPHAFYSQMSPQEFLWCIANAAHVITPSFHGTAFSIIMGTPFHTVASSAPQQRIKTLLNHVGLSHKLVSFDGAMGFSAILDDNIDLDKNLTRMRQHGLNWLKEYIMPLLQK